MPASVQVITAREIAESGYSSTAEVLEKQGGVTLRTLNSNPALTQLSMRGFGESSFGRVLVLVNGERLNNPDMSSPSLLRVPIASISRIEIIRGPQTVLHGDFASAGVINIITDDATAEQQTTLGASVGAYDTYSAFVNTTGMFGEDGVSYRASADWEKSDGYRDNSDYETYQLNAALRKDFGENRFLSLSTFYHDAEYGLPGTLSRERRQELLRDIAALPNLVGQVLSNGNDYQAIASKYAGAEDFLYLGRGINYPIALEGALKLKEISYIHAEGYPAGEMKHGPIALIDQTLPVVAICPRDKVRDKMLSNIEQVRARGGRVIALATEGDEEVARTADDVIWIPETSRYLTPVLAAIPLQLLAYHIAVLRGADVDQPRNLAKSVTVE